MKHLLREYGMIGFYVIIGVICITTLLSIIGGPTLAGAINRDFDPEYTTSYEDVTVNESDFVVTNAVFKIGEVVNPKDYVKVTASNGDDLTKYVKVVGEIDTFVPGVQKVNYEFKWNGYNYSKVSTFVVEQGVETHTVKFTITSFDGEPLQNMKIYLDSSVVTDTSTPMHYAEITDKNGNVTFKNVKSGKYDLIIGNLTLSLKITEDLNYIVSMNGTIKRV